MSELLSPARLLAAVGELSAVERGDGVWRALACPGAATASAPTPLTMPAIGSFRLTRLKPSARAAGTTERSPTLR
jgi:hypothetical protein